MRLEGLVLVLSMSTLGKFPNHGFTAIAAVALTLAALDAGGVPRRGFTPAATDPAAAPSGFAAAEPAPPLAGAKARDAAGRGFQHADEPEEELVADDGSTDGIGLLEDGLVLVTRLTPPSYPVTVSRIRLYFTKFRDQPDPVGQRIRLLAFTDPQGAGKPPRSPRLLVDRQVTIPALREFVDFPVDGLRVDSGDVYVGYQAPRPANGVGFATDTSGPPFERGFWSEDDGATFYGPLEFTGGQRANPMMRAVVRKLTPGGGDEEELSADDGSAETGVVRDGGLLDTPTAKEDVLFEVYRRLKVGTLTSNQMCNDYRISITDRDGKLVESGQSIARNGAYEARLVVADGYQYTVNYTYTTPCADSGRQTGKFDVKGGRINNVRIETPPCER
jgi:hypothetical protein